MTERDITWETAPLRPVAMPTVTCPVVVDWETGRRGDGKLCVSHCLACAHCQRIDLDAEHRSGTVLCTAEG